MSLFREHIVKRLTRGKDWPKFRDGIVKMIGSCECCGSKKSLEVHHCIPWHLDKSKECDQDNVIVLCDTCHLTVGHLHSYDSFNVTVKQDAKYMLDKVRTRP